MTNQTPLPLRNDTILGVCEAIGRDFGFHPNWLRLLFGGLFYFNPLIVTGTYLVLGLAVAASRWIAPDQAVPHQAVKQVEDQREELALAA